jgi:Thioredoxin
MNINITAKYYTYTQYLDMVKTLVADGKSTGNDQSEHMVGYTKLNLTRMERWEKTYIPTLTFEEKIEKAEQQIWWILVESWCGDAAESLVPIHKISMLFSGKIELRIILRDENLPLMDLFLTNGARSIPKLISVGADNNIKFTWGPRPAIAQKLMNDWKNNPGEKSKEDIKKELHLWYARNKATALEEEFFNLL